MYKVGVDIGGTNIVSGVVNERYEIIGRCKRKTLMPRPPEEILADVADTIRLAIEDAEIPEGEIDFIGVGAPGAVDMARGTVLYAPNIKFTSVDVRTRISDELGIACSVCNDATAAAIGEHIAGAGTGCANFVAITLGTGVGGGVYVDGRLLLGRDGAAGELGHMVIKSGSSDRCSCGRYGCFESCCSAAALKKSCLSVMQETRATGLWALCDNDAKMVEPHHAFEAMRLGDLAAKSVIDGYVADLATAVVNIINTFRPELVCLGGGIADADEASLYMPLRAIVRREAYGAQWLEKTPVIHAQLGNDAGIIGAAYMRRDIAIA